MSDSWKNVYLGEFVPRDPEYDTAYEAAMDYHRAMENIDRAWPHMPARKRRMEVIPLPETRSSPGYRQQLAEMRSKFSGLNPEIVRIARRDASNDFDRELKPCECATCTDPYWRR